MTTKKYYGISKLFDSISLNFEIAKSVLYGSFVHDVAFRKFINSREESKSHNFTYPEKMYSNVIIKVVHNEHHQF
jgi:hypothetical protein